MVKGIQCCGDCAGYDRANKKCGYAPIESIIEEHFYKDCPLPDVAEVKHGLWIPISDGDMYECSECGECEDYNTMRYCPRCGARMERGNKKNE